MKVDKLTKGLNKPPKRTERKTSRSSSKAQLMKALSTSLAHAEKEPLILTCPECDGTGSPASSAYVAMYDLFNGDSPCQACLGTGVVEEDDLDLDVE